MELYERYIEGTLSAAEKEDFERRLASDPALRRDFRIYLFTVRGVCQEAQQDNLEFGIAMKNISPDGLRRIIGRSRVPRILRIPYLRERLTWAVSVAAVFLIGVLTVFNVRQAGMNQVDDIIVAENYIPETTKGGESLASDDIPSLERAYREAPADDIQTRQEAGLRLALAYLKQHDRKKAKKLLEELSSRFATDEEFAAQCRKILSQLD